MVDLMFVVEKKIGYFKKGVDYNNVCRVCKVSLIVVYGVIVMKICFKFFKLLQIQELFGDVLVGCFWNVVGFKIVDFLGFL